jgi:hypothetical protein
MTNSESWHGMPVNEHVAKTKVAPPKPPGAKAMMAATSAVTYAHVHFTGNYGGNLCQEYQESDAYNITQDSAHSMAWSLYGLCSHNIYYYDSNGNQVNQE